jgi:hypothetical protein
LSLNKQSRNANKKRCSLINSGLLHPGIAAFLKAFR